MFTRISLAMFLGLAMLLSVLDVAGAQPSPGCRWNGPPAEWVLARHPPTGAVSGTLAAQIVPFLQRNGIPVCFVSTSAGDERVQLEVGPATTLQDVLEEIVRQAPGYKHAAVNGRVVLYPKGEMYDAPVDLGQMRSMTRAAAYFFVLGELRSKTKALQNVFPSLRSEGARSEPDRGEGAGGDKMPYGDTIEVGGSRSIVEHLVSLVQKRPQKAFRVDPAERGKVYFEFVAVDLIAALDLHLPRSVTVGESFEVGVSGTLQDGTAVSLVGPDCEVSYGTHDPQVVEIDNLGRAIARKKGVGTVIAKYESKSATAQVKVQ